ncbi:MAG TPA: UDP-N-acetylmuramoyl-L-alanine--D-glutamate ligase [Patescibacteria group bacterium]|nr:UDP-N-acetylmuramoyl-L-alanine--D-glutamate ligase [Patescibacteria group bacterium]
MKLNDLEHKKILIAGFGIEGKSTEQFLREKVPSATVDIVDREDGPEYLSGQDKYDLVIKSPGIKKELIYVPYTTATNIFFANTKGVTVGVTGTKGKSTTSSLIHDILLGSGRRSHLVGNIGKPMLTELLSEKGSDDMYVCELSSYQLDDIAYSPHIAVFIDFFPEHMNYHGSVEAYWEAKKRIVSFSKPKDFFVFNPKFDRLKQLSLSIKAKSVPYVEKLPFSDTVIPLLGKHNNDNVRAAVTVGKIFDIPTDIMQTAVRAFHPLPHRLELVGIFHGISFYDDAISTTPESTISAILAIDSVKTIFLGGQDRGYDFRSLIRLIHEREIRYIVLFPDSGITIFKLLNEYPKEDFTVLSTSNMEEAVSFAYKHTPQGSSCLLSTASPSYSIWKNFEEKGNLFQHYARNLGK